MRNAIAMIVAVTLAGALSGCGGGSSGSATAANPPPTSGTPPPAGPPTDFAMFVTQQVNYPNLSIGAAPVATSGLTTNLQLDSSSAFASVFFGAGNALPAGVNQAAVACGQAGTAACNPSMSADLNSTLN
jgi:hypothetical protein